MEDGRRGQSRASGSRFLSEPLGDGAGKALGNLAAGRTSRRFSVTEVGWRTYERGGLLRFAGHAKSVRRMPPRLITMFSEALFKQELTISAALAVPGYRKTS